MSPVFLIFFILPFCFSYPSCNGTAFNESNSSCSAIKCLSNSCLTCSLSLECLLCPSGTFILNYTSLSSNTTNSTCVQDCGPDFFRTPSTPTNGTGKCEKINNSEINFITEEKLHKISVKCPFEGSNIFAAFKLAEDNENEFDNLDFIKRKLSGSEVKIGEDWSYLVKGVSSNVSKIFEFNFTNLKNAGQNYSVFIFCEKIDYNYSRIEKNWTFVQRDNGGKQVAVAVFYDKKLTDTQRDNQGKVFMKLFNISSSGIVFDDKGSVKPYRLLADSNGSNSSNNSNASVETDLYNTYFERDFSLLNDDLGLKIIDSLNPSNFNKTLELFNNQTKKSLSISDIAVALRISLIENYTSVPMFDNATLLATKDSVSITLKLLNTAAHIIVALTETGLNVNVTDESLKARKDANGTDLMAKRIFKSARSAHNFTFGSLKPITNYTIYYIAQNGETPDSSTWSKLQKVYYVTASTFLERAGYIIFGLVVLGLSLIN